MPGYANFLWIGIFAVITVVVIHNIVKSDTGRALISIREDELAAEAMGVNTTRYQSDIVCDRSAFAGVAGVLFAHYNKFLSTNDFQFIKSFEIIIMIVIGGMGSMTGAILGAIIVTLLPELLRQLPDIQVGATVVKVRRSAPRDLCADPYSDDDPAAAGNSRHSRDRRVPEAVPKGRQADGRSEVNDNQRYSHSADR